MEKCRVFCRPKYPNSRWALLVLVTTAGFLALQARAAAETVIWDTGSHLASADDAAQRSGWTAVPTELFSFEAEPAKASSDPGYYGRKYTFRGDAVVENDVLSAVCLSGTGRVVIFAKGTAGAPKPGRKILEFNPLLGDKQATSIRQVEILRNASDDAALSVTFAAPGSKVASADLFFDRTGIAEIRPGDNFNRTLVHGPIAYGIVPGFITDDLIYSGASDKERNTLSVPAENLFVGLLPGEDAELVMTWPPGQQQLQLNLAEQDGQRLIESIEFSPAGQSFYLSGLVAPGLWHKEILKPSYHATVRAETEDHVCIPRVQRECLARRGRFLPVSRLVRRQRRLLSFE